MSGTAPDRTNVNGADGVRTVSIPDGFYSDGKTVTVNDADLAPSNILSGVTILGTTGTYTPPAPATCGNGTLDDGEECDLGTVVGTTCETFGFSGGNVSCTTACERTGCYLRIFVTSTSDFTGALGGLQGGHDICRTHAYAAGFTGVWNAYLSTSMSDARDLLDDAVEYRRMDGTTVVAHDSTELAASMLDNTVRNDELGEDARGSDAWTGTKSDGTNHGNNCSDWTDGSSDSQGMAGYPGSSSGGWTASFSRGCGGHAALYCVEGKGTWIPCANEGQPCSFTGLKRVRFGIEGFYVYLNATGGVTCDVATFGEDPIEGIPKQCDYQ